VRGGQPDCHGKTVTCDDGHLWRLSRAVDDWQEISNARRLDNNVAEAAGVIIYEFMQPMRNGEPEAGSSLRGLWRSIAA
jgi:hypothetical protein